MSTASTGSGVGGGEASSGASRLAISALTCVASSGRARRSTLFFEATVRDALGKSGATRCTSASGLMVWSAMTSTVGWVGLRRSSPEITVRTVCTSSGEPITTIALAFSSAWT